VEDVVVVVLGVVRGVEVVAGLQVVVGVGAGLQVVVALGGGAAGAPLPNSHEPYIMPAP